MLALGRDVEWDEEKECFRTLAEVCGTDVKCDLECDVECDLVTLPSLALALGRNVEWDEEKECFVGHWQSCVTRT